MPTDGDTLVVATQSVVALRRIRETFWKRLDGSIDLGVNFTQQDAKTAASALSLLVARVSRGWLDRRQQGAGS